jgi:hypothetical protein
MQKASKIKILIKKMCIFWFIVCNYITMHGAKNITFSFDDVMFHDIRENDCN